jgi:hypothetical protein
VTMTHRRIVHLHLCLPPPNGQEEAMAKHVGLVLLLSFTLVFGG